MRATAIAGAVVFVASAAGAALAQPAEPMPPQDPAAPAPTEPPTTANGYYAPPPPAAYAPPPPAAPEPKRHSGWFGAIGLGGMGYVGREFTPYDNGNKGSGLMLEAAAGKWIRSDGAIGARIEAHTDDSKHYTDSSFTLIMRLPVSANGRFYLEPGMGIGFHKDEGLDETDNGLAVSITGGYQLTRNKFACDLRFGGAHYRIEHDNAHGMLWVGVALGWQ